MPPEAAARRRQAAGRRSIAGTGRTRTRAGGAAAATAGLAGSLQRRRPAAPVRAVQLRRSPGTGRSRAAPRRPRRRRRQKSGPGRNAAKAASSTRALGLPHRRVVDQGAGGEGGEHRRRRRRARRARQGDVHRQRRHVDAERVEEAAVGRVVRAGPGAVLREQGVQRVEPDRRRADCARRRGPARPDRSGRRCPGRPGRGAACRAAPRCPRRARRRAAPPADGSAAAPRSGGRPPPCHRCRSR